MKMMMSTSTSIEVVFDCLIFQTHEMSLFIGVCVCDQMVSVSIVLTLQLRGSSYYFIIGPYVHVYSGIYALFFLHCHLLLPASGWMAEWSKAPV